MSSRTLPRTLLRLHLHPRLPAVAITGGFGAGLALAHARSKPLRLDARSAPRSEYSSDQRRAGGSSGGSLSPEMMKQLSGGSVTGFLSGLLVSVFSRTLVLLLGLSIVVVQVASRYGINLVQQLRVKERVGRSRVLAALESNPAFKLSFGIFFALSAFTQF